MNHQLVRRVHHILTGYLILCFATSAPAAADALARAATCTSQSTLCLLTSIAACACPCAFAGNESAKYGVPSVLSSKPAIWVNYTDPRPKGKDADNGAKPAYLPQAAVNNVSLNATVAQPLFTVNMPLGPAGMAPTLTYSLPIISRKIAELPPNTSSYTFNADAGAFGNCWSDNLAPCIERNMSPVNSGLYKCYELSLNVNGGPAPSVSFKGPDLPIAGYDLTNVFNDRTWTPQPLSKASVLNASSAIEFWGDGLIIDESGAPCDPLARDNYSTWTWPTKLYDRNANTQTFAYSAPYTTAGSFSWSSESGWDVTPRYLRVPSAVANLKTGDSLECAFATCNQDVSTHPSVTSIFTIATVTSVTHKCSGQTLRRAQFTYQNWSYFTGLAVQYTMRLLSTVQLPNGDIISYGYSTATLPNGYADKFNLPILTHIFTPAGTTVVEYSTFEEISYDASFSYKLEPFWVQVISDNGLTTNRYDRENRSYDTKLRTGSVILKTTTPNGTCDRKFYNIFYEPLNMQWYGSETWNELDNLKQHEYGIDPARFLYTRVSRFPVGGGTPSDTSTFAYDTQDNLTCATDALGNATRYFYAPNKLDQTCVIDPRGVVNSNIFDARGNCTRSIEDVGVGGLNRTSSTEYNTAGQPIKTIDPLGRITRNFYSPNRTASLISSNNYNGDPTNTACGWLVATRDALDRVTTYSYDALGRKIQENTPGDPGFNAGRYIVNHTYDIMDRLTCTRFPDGTFISNVYNAAGYPVRVRDRADRWTVNTYDAAGHLIRVDYPNGDWVNKEYTGNLVSKLTDAAGNVTEYYYDHEQLTGVKFPDGSTRAAGFDNLNRQIWAVDERGVAVTNTYDKLDRVVASAYVPYENASTVAGLPTTTTVPNTLQPSTCNMASIYGGFANQVITYAYDKVGNPICMTDWAGTITNAYDNLNRPAFVYNRFAALPTLVYSLAQSYDLADNRLSMTLDSPHDNVQTTFAYDKLNRLTTNTAWTLGETISGSYSYNANGKLACRNARFNDNDPSTLNFSYDSENRVQTINGSYASATLMTLGYTYNNAQQITAIAETLDSTSVACGYTYDARDQLVSETRDSSSLSYSYDQAQNRITNRVAGTPHTYGYLAANKLTNIYTGVAGANKRYFYDRAGNLSYRVVNDVTNWYDYNAQNKLARIRGAGFTSEFAYDSQNRRIALCQNDVWRYEAHDGAVPIGLFHSARLLTRWFVRGVGIADGTGDVLAEVDMSERCPIPTFYFGNHRGDTQLCLDTGGNIVAKYRYDAFGNVIKYSGTFAPRYTFSTKEYLADAKLYLYAYRVYDPIAGRWTQRDPIDYQDSPNLYQFCGNNPVLYFDPFGLAAHAYASTHDPNSGVSMAKQMVEQNEGHFAHLESDISDSGKSKPRSFTGSDDLAKQIAADAKKDKEPVQATIIAHGNKGLLALSDTEKLQGTTDFAALGKKLNGNVASINLVACRVAESAKGIDSCSALANSSGVNVKAVTKIIKPTQGTGLSDPITFKPTN